LFPLPEFKKLVCHALDVCLVIFQISLTAVKSRAGMLLSNEV